MQAVVGRINTLEIIKDVDFGVYLDGGDDQEILLPTRYLPEDYEIGDRLDVFVYLDSEDRIIATTETPFIQVGEFAVLEVVATEKVGAFLDWGLAKDLFLPFAEQTRSLSVGQMIIVYAYLDKSGRVSATMKTDKHLLKDFEDLEEGQTVELLISGKTDLGYKAIINGKYGGVIYENEVFKPLEYGQSTEGFIKKLRPDGKIDLALYKTGHKAGEELAPKILELLKKKGGFLEINDKTSADLIHDLFGVSKKKYKIAIGTLYKKRLITIDDDGIRLVKEK